MKRKIGIFLLCSILCFMCACGKRETGKKEPEKVEIITNKDHQQIEPGEEEKKNEEDPSESLADGLTLEQKVGQLFIVRPDALDPNLTAEEVSDSKSAGVTEVSQSMKEMLAKYPVGGICQFTKNIVSPKQLKTFNANLQAASGIPLFITVDEEGGIVTRLAGNAAFQLPTYQSAASVASSGNTDDAKNMGATIGAYLAEYGFNMDFAPDADVNTNPDNPIIGTRAFSSDAKIASRMVSAAAEGFRESGILPTLKHFPGHGDTAEDSHTSLAVTYKTLEELQECEFLPFESDIGMHAVMVGHIATPNITGNDLPASLSSEIIDLIPDKSETLIVTDSLEMKAVSDTYGSGEAAVMALEAGCDMLLMPMDLEASYQAVLDAVKSGRISEERLEESVNKILSYKEAFGIFCKSNEK